MNNIPFAEIIELARLAPSGDNLQPWNFNIQDNNLVLKYKPSPVEEPAYFETGVYCSMGIMIEYVILAAKSLGFQVETEIKSDFATSLDKQVAVFTFTESPTIDNDSSRLVEAMRKRHTAREPYLKKSLVESARTELEYSVTEKSGLIKWVEDDGGRNLITKFLEISDKQFWSRKDTRRALIESIIGHALVDVHRQVSVEVRQKTEVYMHAVAPRLHGVSRIDEEHVAIIECGLKPCQVNRLHRLL